MYRELR